MKVKGGNEATGSFIPLGRLPAERNRRTSSGRNIYSPQAGNGKDTCGKNFKGWPLGRCHPISSCPIYVRFGEIWAAENTELTAACISTRTRDFGAAHHASLLTRQGHSILHFQPRRVEI